MTRDGELRLIACDVLDWVVMTDQDVADLRIPLRHALAIAKRFADAEAAAMRERAAVVADTIAEIATTNDAQFVAAGASATATAIRALPATGEVGRG